MRKILSFLALLPTLALPAPWSSFSPTVSNLPGKNGTFEPATYTMLTYDDSTRTIVGFQTYNASGETPAYNQTIYSNNVFKLAYHYGASADTIRQLALTNWWTNISGSNSTTPNANFLTSPTPPDVHPYIGSRSGVLFHFGGLNQLIRDTITFHPDSVNLADNYINLPRFTPWGDRDAFRLITTGTLPTSLAANTTYWAIRVSETRIQLASSAANAAAGTAIDLQTSTGTGIHRLVKDTTDAFHYSGIWKLNLTSGIWTQIHTLRAIGWSRGPAHNVAQAVIWHRAQQRFWIHYGKNYPETPEYTWSFDPETDSLKELTTTGNKRSGLSPEIYTSAQSCTYDSRRARMWCWGGVDSLFEYGNTLWHLDTTGAWVEHADRPGNPRARFQHTLLYVRGATAATDSLLMCGGRTNGVDNRDCHKFCIQDSTWAATDSLPTGNAHTYGVVDRVGDGTNSYVVIQQGTVWYEKQMGAADLQALSPATITDDPDPATANEGATAGFTCAATGFPAVAYQWQKDGGNVVGGSGGTTASYTTPTLTAGDNGAAYRCIVSNSQGADTSAAAVLTVLTPPTITDDPDDLTVTEPDPAEFECAAAGSPVISYQWQRNGVNIGGATNPWYILDPTVLADDGDLFRCIATNAAGADTSAAATLTVNEDGGPAPGSAGFKSLLGVGR